MARRRKPYRYKLRFKILFWSLIGMIIFSVANIFMNRPATGVVVRPSLEDSPRAKEVAALAFNSAGLATSSSVQTLASGLQNRLAILEQGVFGQLTVSGSANVGGDLTVAGTINAVSLRLSGKLITSGQTPTGSVLGSASGLVNLTGNDTAGEVEFVLSNSDTPTSGQQFRINFASAFAAKPRVNVTPASAFAGNIRYYVDSDQSGFTVHFTDAPLPGEPYKFNYLVVQ